MRPARLFYAAAATAVLVHSAAPTPATTIRHRPQARPRLRADQVPCHGGAARAVSQRPRRGDLSASGVGACAAPYRSVRDTAANAMLDVWMTGAGSKRARRLRRTRRGARTRARTCEAQHVFLPPLPCAVNLSPRRMAIRQLDCVTTTVSYMVLPSSRRFQRQSDGRQLHEPSSSEADCVRSNSELHGGQVDGFRCQVD